MHKPVIGALPAARSKSNPQIQALRGARLFHLALLVVCVGGLGLGWMWMNAASRAPLHSPGEGEREAPAQAAPGMGALPSTRTYLLQSGTPAAIPNFLQPDQGCAWAGIGGQVFDLAGEPVSGMLVKVSGAYQGRTVSKVAVTGASQGFGPGGYDIYLGSLPQATTLTLQLVDVTGAARSDAYRLATYADCQHNLLVVNLRERLVLGRLYLPLAGRRR